MLNRGSCRNALIVWALGALAMAVVSPGQAAAATPAIAEAAMIAPAAESCGADGWSRVDSTIGESYSPWFDTAKGLDFSRSIKFRSLGGERARQCATGAPRFLRRG
jgi:hypothetical protein